MSTLLVSVLLPTRNRTELVARSVQSLLSRCSDASRIEIIVAFDQDDVASQQYFESKRWSHVIASAGAHSQQLVCEPWGYAGLHRYYTAMARQAQGSWFMIWNDDAIMQSTGWDQAIADEKDFVGMLHMHTANFKPNLTLFPIIPKAWMDLFGEISLHQLNDSWIQDICHEADAVCRLPVTVFHDRYDVTGNNGDETYVNRRYDKKLYNHESMRQIRSDWATRPREYRQHIGVGEPRLDPT